MKLESGKYPSVSRASYSNVGCISDSDDPGVQSDNPSVHKTIIFEALLLTEKCECTGSSNSNTRIRGRVRRNMHTVPNCIPMKVTLLNLTIVLMKQLSQCKCSTTDAKEQGKQFLPPRQILKGEPQSF